MLEFLSLCFKLFEIMQLKTVWGKFALSEFCYYQNNFLFNGSTGSETSESIHDH